MKSICCKHGRITFECDVEPLSVTPGLRVGRQRGAAAARLGGLQPAGELVGAGALGAPFRISHFAACPQLPFARQATPLLLPSVLRGLFACVSWRPVRGQGGLAGAWQQRILSRSPPGAGAPRGLRVPGLSPPQPPGSPWPFILLFPCTGAALGSCPWHLPGKIISLSPLSLHPLLVPAAGPASLRQLGTSPGLGGLAGNMPVLTPLLPAASGCSCSGLFPGRVSTETKAPFLGAAPQRSPEVLPSPVDPRASSQGIFVTLRLLGVAQQFLGTGFKLLPQHTRAQQPLAELRRRPGSPWPGVGAAMSRGCPRSPPPAAGSWAGAWCPAHTEHQLVQQQQNSQ